MTKSFLHTADCNGQPVMVVGFLSVGGTLPVAVVVDRQRRYFTATLADLTFVGDPDAWFASQNLNENLTREMAIR